MSLRKQAKSNLRYMKYTKNGNKGARPTTPF